MRLTGFRAVGKPQTPGLKHYTHELPESEASVVRAAVCSRRLITRRALTSSAASLVPVPGVDLIVDIAMLRRLFSEINAEFGLTPEQIERLTPARRALVYQALTAVGGVVAGKLVTREVVAITLKKIGMRVTAAQAAKYVPVAGQMVSAVLSFGALKLVGEHHVRDCIAVSRRLLDAPVVHTPGVDTL